MTRGGNAQDPGEVFCTATFALADGEIMGQEAAGPFRSRGRRRSCRCPSDREWEGLASGKEVGGVEQAL
jgi:hypothetical protein